MRPCSRAHFRSREPASSLLCRPRCGVRHASVGWSGGVSPALDHQLLEHLVRFPVAALAASSVTGAHLLDGRQRSAGPGRSRPSLLQVSSQLPAVSPRLSPCMSLRPDDLRPLPAPAAPSASPASPYHTPQSQARDAHHARHQLHEGQGLTVATEGEEGEDAGTGLLYRCTEAGAMWHLELGSRGPQGSSRGNPK